MSDPRVNVMASRFIPTVRFKRGSTLWWLLFVGGPIVYGAGPWAISLLAPRYGWAAGYPGPWNLIGLIPVAVGTTGLIWSVALHVAQGPEAVEMERAKSYLLTRRLYAFSRHPTYLSILTLLFGWVIFYGSVAVFIAFVAGCVFFNFAARVEERALEARFGEAYLAYKNKVPRWFGKTRP
jgi:protein-S-isoprenylcysteine O-methyltransferase Ste14